MAGSRAQRTPTYSATNGKLWLEKGGVYVLANIRGGGEFGPKWHEAGLGVHRQLVYDDFAAVATDLIATQSHQPSPARDRRAAQTAVCLRGSSSSSIRIYGTRR